MRKKANTDKCFHSYSVIGSGIENILSYAPRHSKPVFEHMRTAKAQIRLRIAQSDQGLRCPQTDSLDSIECINGE